MYDLQIASNYKQILKSSFFTIISTITFFLLTPFYTPSLPKSRFDILLFYLSVLIAILSWRLFYIEFFVSNRFAKKVILVCDKSQVLELIKGIENDDILYEIIGFVDTESDNNVEFETEKINNISLENLKNYVIKENVKEIVIASQKTDGIQTELYNHLIHLLEKGFVIREYLNVYEESNYRIPLQYVTTDFYKYFPFSRSNSNQLYRMFIRLTDFCFSLTGLLFLLIIIPIVYVINLIANKGELFYTQERVGKNGMVFNIYKFRSMVANAEANGAVFATQNDSRITAFGKFLRKSRIDEIPQYLNVLKGDMSIIGPRPERPVFVNEIAEKMPYYQIRHVIKPGLTGWAQVCYPYGASIDDSLMKLQYDLYYIKHRSIILDIEIISKTLSTVLFYRGQ
jgi:exopolysaccharide biosynthesis polyprenyl glycosylphosphotransferase